MRNKVLRNRKREQGSAMVEFAVLLPLLFMLCMGATDFGRLFYHAVTVANAAGTGAFYGSLHRVNGAQTWIQEQRAIEDANNIEGVTAAAENFCECPGDPPTVIDCGEADNPNACPGYGLPRIYVRTGVQQTFETLGPYPGIPSSTNVNRTIFMRVD